MDAKTRTDENDRRQEKRLVSRARRGDAAALRALVDAHKDRLFAFVRRMIRNHHDAEEIVQDALLKAFASLDSFSTEYRFSTWLFTIAYRLCLNSMRRKRSLTGEMNFDVLASGEGGADAPAMESDAAREIKKTLWNAVDRLSPPQRAAVLLFYQHERNCQDIADVLELPVATVKSHLHRARARLKELLAPIVEKEPASYRIFSALAG